MKFSAQWLKEWVNYPLNAQQLAEQLTMAGLEIESVDPVAGEFNNVVIGKVITVKPHPKAEKLTICTVDVNKGEALTIVCGAANVRANLKVPVALDGAIVQGRSIKTTTLREVTSQGMLCSAQELGLQENSEGLLELPEDAPVGEDIRKWLQLNDMSIDVHLTPNRGDCLSILGIAREVAVLNNIKLSQPNLANINSDLPEQLLVNVIDYSACPRYLGRIIRGVNSNASTPIWMIERLRRSGLRAIHPIVDVANYVMLELGQPLHAFDLNKINEAIIVRYAKKGEQITLLNEQTVELNAETLVIADHTQPLAIAGIMGGSSSAVNAETTDIFLESAFFNPITIAGRARQYGLNTDAAYRYERGVDPYLQRQAIERATKLLIDIVGGKAGPITEMAQEQLLPSQNPILLVKSRIKKILGMEIPMQDVENILQQLGMQVQQSKDQETWLVTPPGYRFDIALEADLIEEIIRVRGYDSIPHTQPQIKLEFLGESEKKLSLARIRNLLIDKGYHEVITYSFIPPKLQQLIDPHAKAVSLLNPISTDLSVMRTSLLPGLLSAAVYNYNRQQNRIRFFETGLRFRDSTEGLQQEPMLAGLMMGDRLPEQWAVQKQLVDFFDMKADVETLIAVTGCAEEFGFQKSEHSALHPGQCSAIMRRGVIVGYLGALHPAVLQSVDINMPVFAFEIQQAALLESYLPQFEAISKFPAIRRDLSFWVDAAIESDSILETIRIHAGELLNDVWLFDVYQDNNKNKGMRSLAIGLLLQHPTRTLVDEEVNKVMEQVIAGLTKEFSINLRE